MDNKIFRLAIPNIITNITIPILGLIDLAIAGRLGSSLYIGAIALGANIFNMLYWNFGFLRMSTSGFASQAYGARNLVESMNTLIRSLIIGLCIGFLIIILQYPIKQLAISFIKSGPESVEQVGYYFNIVVWGAPAVLGMYALKGWFIGMQNAKTPMVIAILNNVLNIILSVIFVFLFDMKISGIALGTCLSQIISFFVALFLWFRYYGRLKKYIQKDTIWNNRVLKEYFRVNRDIFIRTFLLTLVTTFFTFASSGMGETVLAVNALLMQFFVLFSYFMDGFAYAAEALTGRYIGSENNYLLKLMIKRVFFWGLVITAFTVVVYILFPDFILRILTNDISIISEAKNFIIWIVLIPIVGFAAFLWDGIYIGATASVEMRNAMIISTAVFFISYFSLYSIFGNNGLWLSFILYLAFRGISLTFMSRKIFKYEKV